MDYLVGNGVDLNGSDEARDSRCGAAVLLRNQAEAGGEGAVALGAWR